MAKLDKSGNIHCNMDELPKIEEYIASVEAFIEGIYKDSPVRGNCTLTKVTGTDNNKYVLGMQRTGYCPGIVVGYSCSVESRSHWFRTSVVKEIDWDNKLIHTLNSTYKFEFHEG